MSNGEKKKKNKKYVVYILEISCASLLTGLKSYQRKKALNYAESVSRTICLIRSK